MKHLTNPFFYSVFLLNSSISFSQTTYNHSVTTDLDMKSTDNIRIEWCDDKNVYFTFNGRENNERVIQLYKVDADMKVAGSVALGEKIKAYGDLGVDQVVGMKDGNVLITGQKHRTDKTLKLFASPISSDMKIGSSTEIVDLANVDFKSYDDTKGLLSKTCYKTEIISPSFGRFSVSADRNYAGYLCDVTEEKESNEKFHLSVFKGSEFQKQWSKEIEIKHPAGLFFIEKTIITDGGDVIVTGIKFINKKDIEIKNAPNYKYVIYHISGNGEKIKEYEISYKDNFLSDLVVGMNSDNKIICGAFISIEGLNKVTGYLNVIIDPVNGAITNTNANDFVKELILENMSETEASRMVKSIEKGEKGYLDEYDLDKVVFKSDGGFYLAGEEFKYEELSSTGSFGMGFGDPTLMYSESPYVCTFGDVLIISFDKDGKYEWAKKISKRQKSRGQDMMFCSYAAVCVDDELFISFNDNFDKFDPEKNSNGEKPKNVTFQAGDQNECALVISRISKSGEIETKMLKEMKSMDGFIQAFSAVAMNNSIAFFSGINHHNFVHKLTFTK